MQNLLTKVVSSARISAMLLATGPKDTPYENGFFMVDIQLGNACFSSTL